MILVQNERTGTALDSPLISVVIPTFNRSALLRRAIKSVLAQGYVNFEVIVIDDCSSDDTTSVLASITDARLRCIRNDAKRGGAGSRNVGIHHAHGSVIAFLDDDDEWLPAKLERQLAALRNVDAVICASRLRTQGGIAGHDRPRIELNDLKRGYIGGGTSALMVRAEVLRKFGFDTSLPAGQDWDLVIRMAARHRIGYVDEPLVIYDDNDHERISNRLTRLAIPDIEKRMQVLYKHREFFGWFWFRQHATRMYLYRLSSRSDWFKHLCGTIRRYGTVAVTRFFLRRAAHRLLR